MKLVYKKTKTVYRIQSTVYKPGQIMVIAVIFITVILIMTTSLFSRVAGYLQFGSNSIIRNQAVNLAEAGVDRTLWKLNATAGACDATCDDEITVGTTGTFKVSIAEKNPPNPQLKTVISTGYLPNSTNPRAKRTIKTDVQITSEGIAFRYAVQVGSGGVTLANSATINGNVYSNGNITGSGSSKIIGEAYAVGAISSPDPTITVPPPHPLASPQPLPTFDYQFWKDAAEQGTPEVCTPTCIIDIDKDIGPKKYTGNLEITNNAIVTLKGPIWVAKDVLGNGGNFSVSQGGTTLELDNSFGSSGTVLIIDGNADLTQGGNFQPTNANPKGYISLVTTSTSSQAIRISQSGATAIFYTLGGGTELSQTASVAALVAKSLSMSQNSELNYDTGLASSQFSTGPGGSWQIKKGTYRFTNSP